MSKVTVGLWVPLQAKAGKEAEVEEFLKAADLFADAPQIHQIDVIAEKL